MQIFTTATASLLSPAPGGPKGIGPNEGGEPFIVFRQNGKIFLTMATEANNITVMEYDPAAPDLIVKAQIPVSGGGGAQDLMFDHNKQILYYGKRNTSSVAVNSFRAIWSMNLANAAALSPNGPFPTEIPFATLPTDCRNADITPTGDVILLKCLPSQLLKLETGSGAISSHSLPAPTCRETSKLNPPKAGSPTASTRPRLST
jgi:hypothetical protein